ncbi:MAG: hypothetical protein KF773_14325 [Deltaproteobacteria bacterium]|nr:hypothetical protein [Deltaproteobacteria bacterium]MCW5805845.1 hypothetical protein [Deltaproteobacteria bacterium]
MAQIRLLALPLLLVACGGDDGGNSVIVPEGMHTGMVVKEVKVPTNSTQAREFGLDLGASKSSKLDGTVDNQLGMVLGTLAGQGFDVQGGIDQAVASGDIILLVDFQTKDFAASSAAGISVKLGANPQPPACADANDMTCGKHLAGGATFTVAANSPNNAALAGKIVGNTFTGGPGKITLQISLGGTEPITLDLYSARAKASGISATGITNLVFAGALTKADLDSKVIPAIHGQLGPLITRDCTGTAPPEPCGCAANSTGKTILDLFDTNPKDCTVSVAEIQTNTLIQSLLSPDVCAQTDGSTKDATCDAPNALSLGIAGSAINAMFPLPAE